MESIRSRLATYYALALTGTMAVFGAAVYWERSTIAPREAEQQLDARLAEQAGIAVTILEGQAAVVPVTPLIVSHPGAKPGEGVRELSTEAKLYLDAIPEYVFVSDSNGRVVYLSPLASSLPVTDAIAIQSLLVRRPVPVGPGEFHDGTPDPPLRYQVDTLKANVGEIGAVLVAARPEIASNGLEQILLSMLLIAPLILGASASLGYWLAGRALRPVEVMIDELGAIQDGTSLNRRLAVPQGDDEISRLGQKLNDMLGRVEHSFVALRRFTADASHELKTPLMVLRAGVERSLTHPQTPGEIVPALDETLRQINQMNELVTNLLILARADEGRARLTLVDIDLRTLVNDVAETGELLGEERHVKVVTEIPPYPLELAVDGARIRQLLINLLTNAIKYTGEGGQVTIALVDGPAAVTFAVRDTGIGIAPGDLPNVFERFWRADLARSRTGEHPGTGLGLAISKWIAEAHGGTIGATSRPGRGSVFSVVLPKPELPQ